MGIYLEKTPPSPTLTSFQAILTRRYRTLLLAAIFLFALTSIYTVFAVGFADSHAAPRVAPTELRPVTLRKGDGRVRSLIPRKIWQIMLPKGGQGSELYNVDPEQLRETKSWLGKNIDYQYTLLGPRTADEFVEANFSHNPRLISAYRSLTNMGMKSDLLRYLLLSLEGGVYSDIDTVAIRPIDAWIPRRLREKVRLVVGIEFDKRDGSNWADIPHDLQFCQWTIGAAPGHPVFARMVDGILDSLGALSEKHGGMPISEITPESFEVMNSTGPAAWTDAVFETLQGYDPSLKETKDLSFMEEARLIGDVLVLTIDGFGMGQIHSASTNDGTVPMEALAKHLFWGSWREPKEEEEEKEESKDDQKEEGQDGAGEEVADESKKEEALKLSEEATRLQEAQRLQQEAERLQEGAVKLQEEAQRQKEEAMKSINAAANPTPPKASPQAGEVVAQGERAETSPSPSPSTPRPAETGTASENVEALPLLEEEADEGKENEYDGQEEVLIMDTSAPPTTPDTPAKPKSSPSLSSKAEERKAEESKEEEIDLEEVLLMDTGAPAWPGPDWAP